MPECVLFRRITADQFECLTNSGEVLEHCLAFRGCVIAITLDIEIVTPFLIAERSCVQETDVKAVAADRVDGLYECSLHVQYCEDHHETGSVLTGCLVRFLCQHGITDDLVTGVPLENLDDAEVSLIEQVHGMIYLAASASFERKDAGVTFS